MACVDDNGLAPKLKLCAKCIKLFCFFICFFIWLSLFPSHAVPQGGEVAAGDIAITYPTDTQTLITQTTQRGIINWQSFSIGSAEHVHFEQPSASSITLNRVIGSEVSRILGRLSATGRIMLVNQAGIFFGPNSVVDVAGLIATTSNIADADFLAGTYRFLQTGNPAASIIAKGQINVAREGIVALMAPGVEHTGVITANLGKVVLGSVAQGSSYVVDLYGDDLVHFSVRTSLEVAPRDQNNREMSAAVSSTGAIYAHGGKILLTARDAKGIVHSVINTSGIIEANTVAERHGEIYLDAGDQGVARVAGTLHAKGEKPGEMGGKITVLGDAILIAEHGSADIDVSGAAGGGEIFIGGGFQGGGDLSRATITYIGPEARLSANALIEGAGGQIIAWSDGYTGAHGVFEAMGGVLGGSGGLIETSGHELNVAGIKLDLSSVNGELGTWLLDPRTITIAAAGVNYSAGVNNLFANTPGTDVTILNTSLDIGANIILQANQDITVIAPINLTTDGASLTMQAGRDININANITTNNGAINLTANDANAIVAYRGAGAGDITMGSGVTIDSQGGSIQGGNITLIVDPITTGAFKPGNITLQTITTGGGALSISSPNAVTLNNSINTGVGTIIILANQDATGGQDFTMSAGSSITTSNATANAVNIRVNTAAGGTGNAVLRNITTGGGDITVTTFPVGSTGIIGDDIILEASQALLSNGGNISLTAGDDVLLDNFSSINAGSGTVTILANQDAAAGQDFTMDIGSSIVAGTTNITVNTSVGGTGTVTLRKINTNNLIIGTYRANIADSVDITVSGTTTLDAGTGSIALNSAGNNFNILAITSADDATINDINAIILGGVNVIGDFNLITNGAITQSGAVIVGGDTILAAGVGNDITLTNISNDFVGDLSIISANNVSLYDINSLNFEDSTISGNLNVTTLNANITDSGNITVAGITVLDAGSGNIILNQGGNDFATLAITNATNAIINDTTGIILGGVNVSNNLVVSADADITQTAAITTGNDASFIAAGGNITLTHVGNNFGGILSLANTGANNIIINNYTHDLLLGDITMSNNPGTLTLKTTGGSITQSGTTDITTGTGLTTLAASGDVVLINNNNFRGPVTIATDNNATIVDINALTLANITTAGTFAATAGGNLNVTTDLNTSGVTTLTSQGGTVDLQVAQNLLNNLIINTNGGSLTLNNIISGNYNLTLNAGAGGDITINANLGTVGIPLNLLTITNANNVVNNAIIYTSVFSQQAGSGTTYLGAIAPGGGTNVTGASTIITNNVTGYIYTGALSILTNAANIFGLVAGSGGQAGADAIVLLNVIGPGTHFFDGIDLYTFIPSFNPQQVLPNYPDILDEYIDVEDIIGQEEHYELMPYSCAQSFSGKSQFDLACAEAMLKLNKPYIAMMLFNRVLARNPQSFRGRIGLIKSYVKLKMYNAAKEELILLKQRITAPELLKIINKMLMKIG